MNAIEAVADQVVLRGITFDAQVGLDLWHRSGKTQPVDLEVHLTPPGGLEAAAQEDNVAYTIDYGKLYKALKGSIFNGQFQGISQLYQAIKANFPETVSWTIIVTLPKAILEANGGLVVTWHGQVEAGGLPTISQVVSIRDIECRCIIGVNDNERLEKQRLSINLSIVGIENRLSPAMIGGVSIDPSPSLTYQNVAKEVAEVSFAHLEKLLLTRTACRRLDL